MIITKLTIHHSIPFHNVEELVFLCRKIIDDKISIFDILDMIEMDYKKANVELEEENRILREELNKG